MRRILLPAILLFAVSGVAQDSSYQIKNYKYRTPGFRALAASFNLSGTFGKTNTDNGIQSGHNSIQFGPASASYARVISTEKRLHQSALNVSTSGSFLKSMYNQKEARQNRFSPGFSWDRNDRFYLANKWFFEVGNYFSSGYAGHRVKDTVTDYRTRTADVFNKLTIGIGKGRVERVQDAQMALYILNDLAAQGLVQEPVTAETVNDLAVLITDINNRRVFDSRRRRIYELARIDSFLRSGGLTGVTDIRHFTTINDNWALAFNPYRLSGDNWYVRFQPSLLFSLQRNTNFKPAGWPSTHSETSTLDLAPVVGYENYKAVNLQWQRNYGASVSYTKTRTLQQTSFDMGGSTNTVHNDFSVWSTLLNGFYGIGFFPNNRTQINMALRVEAAWFNDKSKYVQPALNFDANYFISYRTFLTASANIGYIHREWLTNAAMKSTVNDIFSSASVTLSHVLF